MQLVQGNILMKVLPPQLYFTWYLHQIGICSPPQEDMANVGCRSCLVRLFEA